MRAFDCEKMVIGDNQRRKKGIYYTLSMEDNIKENQEVIDDISDVLKELFGELELTNNKSVLVVGLGNESITPDSLGPVAIEKVFVTRHLLENDSIDEKRSVSAMAPGVMGQTGIETALIIKSVVEKIKPDFLIVVDALASRNMGRINKTIQITTSGISPGSGVGNRRQEISSDVLGIPVIAIGVATVVDAASIAYEAIECTLKHLYHELIDPKNPLEINRNDDVSVPKENKKEFMGLVGNLSEEELRSLLLDSLNPTDNYIVTPKTIDEDIKEFSKIISSSINQALCVDKISTINNI